MRQIGVLGIILPGADDRWIAPLVEMESRLALAPDWHCRLACLGGEDVPNRLRLSRSETDHLRKLRDAASGDMTLPEVAYRHGAEIATQAQALRAALTVTPPETSGSETLSAAANAVLPIRAADLMPTFSGPALGRRLAELEQHWIDSGFTLDRDALLALP